MPDTSAFPCPNCQIGICKPTRTTYLKIYNGMLVSVPNTPVWRCDICQYQEFEHQTVARLETMLGISDSTPEMLRNTPKITSIEPADPTSARRMKP